MAPNNMFLSSNMEEENTGGEHTVQNYYLSALISVNITTPSPTDEFVVLSNPAKLHRIVETVGIVAALAVGAIIIIGVAFIMSKLRKRNSQPEELPSSCEVVKEAPAPQPTEPNLPCYDVKHVYSITGVIVSTPSKSRRSLKTVLLPTFLKKKPAEMTSVHDALKKDLSRIYVY